MLKRVLFLFFIFSFQSVSAVDKASVFVSIPPMQYLMERIVGDTLEVHSLVGSNDNAELYEPGPKQLILLSRSDLYFPMGLPFEKKWLSIIRENNKQINIVKCCEEMMHQFSQHEHQHGEQEHDKDPHIWTDPVLSQKIAEKMLRVLVDIYPEMESVFVINHASLHEELALLHKELLLLTSTVKQKKIIVSHPAWSYFSERYGIEQIPLEYEGREIGLQATIALVTLAKQENIKRIFVQKQIKSNSAITLARQIDAEIIELDPLAKNHIENLRLTAKLIAGQ